MSGPPHTWQADAIGRLVGLAVIATLPIIVGACAVPASEQTTPMAASGATTTPGSGSQVASRPWEPFAATYRIAESEEGVGTTETWRVEWRTIDDWTMTAVAGSTAVDDDTEGARGDGLQEHALPGTVITSDSSGITLSIPGVGDERIDEEPAAPNDWLQPRYDGPEWTSVVPDGEVGPNLPEETALLATRVETVPCGEETCTSTAEVTLDNWGLPITWTATTATSSTTVKRLEVDHDPDTPT